MNILFMDRSVKRPYTSRPPLMFISSCVSALMHPYFIFLCLWQHVCCSRRAVILCSVLIVGALGVLTRWGDLICTDSMCIHLIWVQHQVLSMITHGYTCIQQTAFTVTLWILVLKSEIFERAKMITFHHEQLNCWHLILPQNDVKLMLTYFGKGWGEMLLYSFQDFPP